MKARMTSRVTVMPKLESSDESPAKGRRHGTRASAAAKCAASSDTSNATIGLGAVFTSGRFPIAMGVRLPRPGRNVNTATLAARRRSAGSFPAAARWHRVEREGVTVRAAVVPYAGNTHAVAVLPARGSR